MRAFISTVPFTIIEAINFVVAYDIPDADLYMVNVFNDAQDIYHNICKTGVFKNVYFVEDVLLTYPITVKKCIECVKNGKRFIKEAKKRHYDEVYYNNSGWLINSIFYTAFYKGNKNIRNCFLEHGYYSYTNDYDDKPWYMRTMIHLMGMRCLDDRKLSELFMFHPEIMKMPSHAKISKMCSIDKNNKKLVDAINTTFDYHLEEDAFVGKQCVIMEQGVQKYSFNKDAFWDRVFENINKNSAIIKAHPRQKESTLAGKGIEVCNKHTIPWEVEILNIDTSKLIQMTIFSGTCVSPKLIFNEEPRVVFLYKLLDVGNDVFDEKMITFADDLGNLYQNKSRYFVPSSFDELRKYMEEIENG